MKNKPYYHLAGSFTLLLFAALCYIVRFYPTTLKGFDETIIQGVHSLAPTMDTFFLWVTKFANPLTIVILAAVFLGLFWFSKERITAIWLGANLVIISGVVNQLLKLFFQRARPTILPHMVTEHSYSFPSGHSVTSMILYGTLIFTTGVFIKNKFWQYALQILLGLLILGIGVSRIYLGVHFPTDVLGGFLLGISWLLFTYPYYRQQKLVYDLKTIGRK
ncbi:phosphatase PAP2 family protein [Candidatus Enterococcus ferrettii]|uniref:Undecaprenyl-diphosphatase n=1 Tax=Candidatus Enterococcus ferrettii TaxID=2815324 RepID=A0ABV0EL99_9ENTE|nr:phosphatase PAP2 family protein [Enterococcus sp. 665A]MBO1340705.1 phosphatase PAP2 family protein [Enterococcus sp. 665A]